MFTSGMVVLVDELFVMPQFHRSLEKTSSKKLRPGKISFLLMIDIFPPFLKIIKSNSKDTVQPKCHPWQACKFCRLNEFMTSLKTLNL
jgi:hypothetical protein